MRNSNGPHGLDCVPTIPWTTEFQVYLQTILLHLAAVFGELFPQKCKQHYPQPSMGKSNRAGCIQDAAMRCTRLKFKQPDELKRCTLCAVPKSDECCTNLSMEGNQDTTHCLFSLHAAVFFHLFLEVSFCAFLPFHGCIYVWEQGCPIVSSS